MYKRILVPVDGSETSSKAVAAAVQLARDSGGCLHVIHALDEFDQVGGYEYTGKVVEAARKQAAKILDDAIALARAAGIEADTRLMEVRSRPLGEVVADEARAWEADLVVVGTHGRRGVGRVLLGSDAEQVIRMAPVPVLAVRSPSKPGAQ